MSQTTNGGGPDRESAHESLREVEARSRLLVDSVRDYAIFMLDRDGMVTTWNRGAEQIKGYSPEEIVGQHFSRFYPPEDVEKCHRELAEAIAHGRFEDEGWRVRKDGSRFWANVVLTPVRDGAGDVLGFAKVTRDLTERHVAEQARLRLAETMAARAEAEASLKRLTRLHRVTAALAAAKTPDEIARVIVDGGVQALQATSAGFVRPRGEQLETVAASGVSAQMLARLPTLSPDAKVPLAVAFKRRSFEWVESTEEFRERYPDVPIDLLTSACCALPLVVGDRPLGVVGYRFEEPRSFGEHERALIETFANQAAQALERTDLYVREVVARERLEALSKLAQELSSALTAEDVARVVVERGRLASGADTVTIYSLDARSRMLELIGEHGAAPGVVERVRTIGPDSGNPFYATLTTGEDVWIESALEYADYFPALAKAPVDGPRVRAFWSLPLVSEGKAVGLLGMGFFQERRFPPEERAFVRTFSRHCAEALQRARRLEAERTARTLAETAQASLETTLRSIGDAVIATDAGGRVSIMNPTAEALTGWSEADARGRPLPEVFVVVNELTREPVQSPVDEVFELGTVVGLANHTVLVHRDGKRETPIDDSGAPIRGPSGRLEGVVLVFRDVTASKREEARRRFLDEATAALAESLDYETTLARVARLAVPRLADWCAVDIREPGRQPRARRLAVAHADPDKIELGRALGARYLDPSAPAGVPNVLRTGRSELYPEITEAELRASAYDAEQVRVARELQLRSAMIVPLVARGRTLGAMTYAWAESEHSYAKEDLAFAEELGRRCGLAVDNARLYAAEQRARESADVANRAKDEFLATVSHELRTPLNAIMGWAKLMSSGRIDDSRRSRAIETIDRNAVAMAQLIEDLLDISRIISGKMRLEVQPIAPARVIDAAIESVKPAADAKEIPIASRLDRSATSALMGDPTRLQQVVWNLLSNAVKFTEKGGRIDVDLRLVDSELEISVADSGKGIHPSFLPHVFDAFRQEDASHTRSRGGLGLGLAITKQLVELHGGRIEAQSEGEGRGARFVVRLPATVTACGADERAASPRRVRVESSFECPEQLAGVRALVVDDEEDARLLVKAVLEECGCRVTLATDAETALRAVEAEPPDVLVSDIGMPNQDGYDLIRRVRRLPPERGGNVPAAAITAYARAEDRRRVLDAGYSMHIPKPIEPAELVAVVTSLLRFGKR